MLRQLTTKLCKLCYSFPLICWCCSSTSRGWASSSNPDKLRVESEGHEGLGQLAHVELHHICNHVGMNVRQVDKLCTDVLKRLAELLHLAFDPGHPVDALHRCSPAIHYSHTSLDQGRDFCSNFKKVVTKINPKGCHLAKQALGPTEQ